MWVYLDEAANVTVVQPGQLSDETITPVSDEPSQDSTGNNGNSHGGSSSNDASGPAPSDNLTLDPPPEPVNEPVKVAVLPAVIIAPSLYEFGLIGFGIIGAAIALDNWGGNISLSEDNRSPAPGVINDPYSPREVDRRRSELRDRLGAPSLDPDSTIPDQGPGSDQGGHDAKDRKGHSPGQRNIGADEEHSMNPKGAPKIH